MTRTSLRRAKVGPIRLSAGTCVALLGCMSSAFAGPGSARAPVPVTEEPLHVVRHESQHFILYTNWIEPGSWTLYHEHRNDQMSVIAADVVGATQVPGEEPRQQGVPAGTALFFPYADSMSPYVHRVGARGTAPFVNFGLEFRDPPGVACTDDTPRWHPAHAELRKTTRRGQAHRLTLPAGAVASLPQAGRALLLVPLGSATLQLDDQAWHAELGGFQFYESKRPAELRNAGRETATLMVVDGC
jgi:hypothetical protein